MHVKAYEQALSSLAGKTVLDFGCGAGYGADILAKHVNHLIAVDVSEEAITNAAAKYSANNLHFQHIEPIEKVPLPFSDDSFDVVLSFQVIEHIKDTGAYLREIQRVLKPCGKFFLTTPNAALRLLPGQRPWNRFHVKEYNYDSLRQTLEKEFASVKIGGLTAVEAWLKMEKSRTNRIRWLLFPFTNVLVPNVIRKGVLRIIEALLISRRGGKLITGRGRTLFPKTEEVFITSGEVKSGLSFYAVCDNEKNGHE